MSTKSNIDVEFLETSLKELERCKGEDDSVLCTYNAVVDDASEPEAQKIEKKNIIKYLLATNHLNKLYFMIRSGIMTLISGLILIAIIAYLGSINVFEAIILGIFIYFISLLLSRMLNRMINRGTNLIIKELNKHEKFKNKLLNNM